MGFNLAFKGLIGDTMVESKSISMSRVRDLTALMQLGLDTMVIEYLIKTLPLPMKRRPSV